jgi:RND family efflux transporter MFP subunit
MKKKKAWMIGGSIVIVGVILVGVLGQNSKKNNIQLLGPEGGTSVQVGKASITDVMTRVSSSGVLFAEAEETIFAQSSNQVKKIEKKVGDEVKSGEVLFILDGERRETLEKEIEKMDLNIANAKIAIEQLQGVSKQEILQAESSLAELDKGKLDTLEAIRSAKESIRLAKMDQGTLEKQKELTQTLFLSGLASSAEIEKARKDVETLAENIKGMENQLLSLERSLETLELQTQSATYQLNLLLNVVEDEKKEQTIQMRQNEIRTLEIQRADIVKQLDEFEEVIVAPMDGILTELAVEEGAYFSQGIPLAKIINSDKLIVKADISPFYASQLQVGLDVNLKFNGSQTIEFEGKISKVSPTANTTQSASGSSTTIPIEIEVIENVQELKPGLTVDVRIITNDVKDVVTIPLLGVMEDAQSEAYVFVVKEDFTLEKRYIKQGVADNQVVEVEGMQVGEIVVTNPTEALQDGMSVRHMPFPEGE